MEGRAARERLQGQIDTIGHIMELTGCPSVGIGVLHQGQTIFEHFQGLSDVTRKVQVDKDTCYMIGSLTKAFVSASCGILVEEGKLDWAEPMATYIPFHQKNDPVIAQRACLADALSHSSGFPQIDISWYGADGESILDPGDLLHVTSHMPVFPDFRAKLHYSNWPYALAGRIIEAVGGNDASDGWGGFVQKRIFDQLSMSRSTTSRADLVDRNFAEPHTVLSSRQPARLPVPDISSKTITGAAMAIWSTVPDMLTWSKAILERLKAENQHDESKTTTSRVAGRSALGNDGKDGDHGDLRGVNNGYTDSKRTQDGWPARTTDLTSSEPQMDLKMSTPGEAVRKQENPLRQVLHITSHRFPITDDTVHENTYGFGWARHQIPSCHLGWLSINGPQKCHIIGAQSQPRLLLYHGGQVTGYLNSIYVFPETDSAIVVLTNAQSLGDCSDLVGQALVQALFKMEPELDFRSIAASISGEHLLRFDEMKTEYESNRVPNTKSPDLREVEGVFMNSDIRVKINVSRVGNENGRLEMRLNDRESQRHRLQHYHYDTFGFLPESRDEKELRCLVDYGSYQQFLLSFVRGEQCEITGLEWVMENGFPPLRFERLSSD
ncbi:beta-lactamase/transpeptidase-like protein [Trematosphaeria pertusa]|uniref:Beta-lactamase/transpeptidase-like protein n=1 Tax=Trematosphaeria pertusa TaxID=390896 RepID=A0A6A6J3R4_9PLEO|nr:beta-lactamase/transpeptidase-like protein [Trematosphaeria pertusa]KAF2256540.1 beta-lactamase/transpeptidase-like protein [Trematosphaeria pertusa]